MVNTTKEIIREREDKFYCIIYNRMITDEFYEEEKPSCMGEIGCYACSFRIKPKRIKFI